MATAATAQVQEEDTEDNEEVLAILECASGEDGGNDKDEGNDEDIFETIEAFKSNINDLGRIWGLGEHPKRGRLQFMVGAWTYALAVNFVPSYRDTADKIGDSVVGIKHAPDEEKAVHDDEWEEKVPGEAVVQKRVKV